MEARERVASSSGGRRHALLERFPLADRVEVVVIGVLGQVLGGARVERGLGEICRDASFSTWTLRPRTDSHMDELAVAGSAATAFQR
eukprot:2912470-Pyramimonas_sp.AAC.1